MATVKRVKRERKTRQKSRHNIPFLFHLLIACSLQLEGGLGLRGLLTWYLRWKPKARRDMSIYAFNHILSTSQITPILGDGKLHLLTVPQYSSTMARSRHSSTINLRVTHLLMRQCRAARIKNSEYMRWKFSSARFHLKNFM